MLMTGSSGDPSPFLVGVYVDILENIKGNIGEPSRGSFVVYPTNIGDKNGLTCKTTRGQIEYKLTIIRNGPADKTNSFFFVFWVRDFPYSGKTYILWRGYLADPKPKTFRAFNELHMRDFDKKSSLFLSITTHIFSDEKDRARTLEYLNEGIEKSTIPFTCYTEKK